MPITLCLDRTYLSYPVADLLELYKRRYLYELALAPDDGDSREMNAIAAAGTYSGKYDELLQ